MRYSPCPAKKCNGHLETASKRQFEPLSTFSAFDGLAPGVCAEHAQLAAGRHCASADRPRGGRDTAWAVVGVTTRVQRQGKLGAGSPDFHTNDCRRRTRTLGFSHQRPPKLRLARPGGRSALAQHPPAASWALFGAHAGRGPSKAKGVLTKAIWAFSKCPLHFFAGPEILACRAARTAIKVVV